MGAAAPDGGPGFKNGLFKVMGLMRALLGVLGFWVLGFRVLGFGFRVWG